MFEYCAIHWHLLRGGSKLDAALFISMSYYIYQSVTQFSRNTSRWPGCRLFVAEWPKSSQTASTPEWDMTTMRNQVAYVAKSMRRTVVLPSQVALSRRRLTDHIRSGVRILFVGINPGLRSAATGHHFAGYSNRFWKLLFESKLVPVPLTHQDDWRLPDWGIGLTNIIQRPSAGIDVLKPRDYVAGRKRLIATVKHYRPRAVALLGVTIYRTLFPESRAGRISLGPQAKTLADCPVFVLANPSGRNAHYSYQTMLKAFRALRTATKK